MSDNFISPAEMAEATAVAFEAEHTLDCHHNLVTSIRSEGGHLICSECSAPIRKRAEATR